MSILLAGLGSSSGPEALPHGLLTHTWVGWDGSKWDLSADESPVRLGSGVRGMAMPPTRRSVSTSPTVPGSRTRSVEVGDRPVFWPVHVLAADGAAWLDADDAFMRTMHPEKSGVWTVTRQDGRSRSLRILYVEDGDFSYEVDPTETFAETYGLTFVAPQPYWYGPEVSRTFAGAAPVDFYTGFSSGYFISRSRTPASAKITNPGDVAAWPVYTITAGAGGLTGWQVGLNGHVVGSLPLDEGRTITIDTDPQVQTAILDDGTDLTASLPDIDFSAVPAGVELPLSLDLDGAGSITVSLVPRYWRAW